MPKHVLVTSAGRRVSLVQGFQSACRPLDRHVFAADATPELSAACQVADDSFKLPRVADAGFMDAFAELCERRDIGLVIPTIDTELPTLAAARSSFEQRGIHLVVSEPEVIDDCADKRRTHGLFARHGLGHPATYEWPDVPGFPLFAKPWDGSLSRGIEVLHDAESTTRALARTERLMLCEYLDPVHHDEFTIDCYYDRTGKLRGVVPRQRLKVRGGEVAKALTVHNELVDLLFDRLGQLDGARGVLTMQAFVHRDTRTATFIEINARFGGGYPLSRHAGADYQRLLVNEYLLGTPVPDVVEWADRTMMLRYDAEVIRRNVGDVDGDV